MEPEVVLLPLNGQVHRHIVLSCGLKPLPQTTVSNTPFVYRSALSVCAPTTTDAPINTLQACITNGGFASLQGLNLSGCNLSYEQLTSLFQQLASAEAVLPSLKTLEVGANPGVQHEGFVAEVQELRGARRGLDVHWRVADSDAPPQQ